MALTLKYRKMRRLKIRRLLVLAVLVQLIFVIAYNSCYQTWVQPQQITTQTQILKRKCIPNPGQQNNLNASTVYTAECVVDRFLQRLDNDMSFPFSLQSLYKKNFSRMVLQLGRAARFSSERLNAFKNMTLLENDPNYVRFHHGIRKLALYDPTDVAIDGLLHDMATQKIVNVSTSLTESTEEGTTLKLIVTFKNGGKAMFKPMRLRRDEIMPDCHFSKDVERHYAEIASFHLDKMLGFYMVPPVTGRVVSITDDIRTYVESETEFSRTFFTNEAGQLCFMGTCHTCPKSYSACGTPDLIEGCLKAFLPDKTVAPMGSTVYVYSCFDPDQTQELKAFSVRKYHKVPSSLDPDGTPSYAAFDQEPNCLQRHWIPIMWKNESYCKDNVVHHTEFKSRTSQLDLADHSIFIYLKGDIDSRVMEHFRDFGKTNRKVLLDNGKGFCTPVDEPILLTAVRQCCKIRYSTFLKFAKLYIGPEKLSEIVDASMKKDPLYPILVEHHLMSLDRRVTFVLQAIAECVEKSGSVTDVIIDDKL